MDCIASVISSDPPIKDVHAVVLLTRKVFISESVSIASYIQEMKKELQIKINISKKQLIYNSYLIRQRFQEHSHLCMEGHLKLRLQSLKKLFFEVNNYYILSTVTIIK